MLKVTLHENDKLIGTLRIGRVSGAAKAGPHNDYGVAWIQVGAKASEMRHEIVTGFDRTRGALALVAEAVKALRRE